MDSVVLPHTNLYMDPNGFPMVFVKILMDSKHYHYISPYGLEWITIDSPWILMDPDRVHIDSNAFHMVCP